MTRSETRLPTPLVVFQRSVVAVAITLSFSHAAFSADTGDAPESYGQASHTVVFGSPFLGDDEPDDNNAVAGIDALGDDNDGFDDEGGVFAFPVLVQNGKSYDTNVFASNPSTEAATLVGWVDFDGNGRFEADEAATATVEAGADNQKYKLQWPDLTNVSSSFAGTTYARFRISTDDLTVQSMQGGASDGEVEDYSLEILLDSDGDERPDITDLDNDNDGIPDSVEGITVDSDQDGTPDYLDVDSDADFIPDYVEAGRNPQTPADTDNDGVPDYLDQDSNGDGIPDSQQVSGDQDQDSIPDSLEGELDSDRDGVLNRDDLDSDNDTIPDVIEADINATGTPVDTDGDGIADYLDLDSDNDGIADIREANSGEFDVRTVDRDNDGRVDAQMLTGVNGYVDLAETVTDSGVPMFAIVDTDRDGQRDFRETDSDSDGVSDILESGGTDADADGVVDSRTDIDRDGLIDGANIIQILGSLPDVDGDFIPDFQDADANGSTAAAQPDTGGTPTDQTDGSTTGTGQGGNDSSGQTGDSGQTGGSGQTGADGQTGTNGQTDTDGQTGSNGQTGDTSGQETEDNSLNQILTSSGSGCSVGAVGMARTDTVLWLLLALSIVTRGLFRTAKKQICRTGS